MSAPLRILLIAEGDGEAAWLTDTLRAGGRPLATCTRVDDEPGCRVALASAEGWDAVVCVVAGGGDVPPAMRPLGDLAVGAAPSTLIVADSFDQVAGTAQRLGAIVCLRAQGLAHLGPALDRALRVRAAAAERARAAAFEEGHGAILESIAAGSPLASVLEEIVLLIERQAEGMLCSILLLDRERGTVHHGAAPHLPRELTRGVDGAAIGPREGSCGAAAYLGEPVVVEDIATHPNWDSYRHLVLPAGLRACWSSPIFSAAGGDVLGTFAMYYRETRPPTERERAWVGRATHLAAVAISRDRMAEAVRSSERLRHLMYDAVTDVLFYIGVEGEGRYRFLSVNRTFLAATGLREDQVVHRLIDEVIPEPSLTKVKANYARAIAERRPVSWDEISPYPAGLKYGEVCITPICDEDGRCTNLVGTVHDVTERRQAEERLATQAALLEKAKDAIIVRDLDGVVHFWNHGAERLYGWSRGEAVDRSVAELIYRDRGPLDEAHRRLVENGEWSGEIAQVTKAGRPLVVEGSWTLLRDDQGRPRSVLAINSDVTEKKRLEAQVVRIQRLESLGTQAGCIAHDFNNVLTVIASGAEIARRALSPDHPAYDPLTEVMQATAHGTELTRQILTFSRQHELRRQVVKLDLVIAEALGLLRATIPRTVRINTRFDAQAPEVLADATQIHQIVINLGRNAAQAMGGKGSLEVRVQPAVLERPLATDSAVLAAGCYAALIVSDTGAGMDDATRERIFDPFFTTKAAGEGTGLGLSVVHGIVKSHDGGIVVRSAPGDGAEFTLYLPAARRPHAERSPPPV